MKLTDAVGVDEVDPLLEYVTVNVVDPVSEGDTLDEAVTVDDALGDSDAVTVVVTVDVLLAEVVVDADADTEPEIVCVCDTEGVREGVLPYDNDAVLVIVSDAVVLEVGVMLGENDTD